MEPPPLRVAVDARPLTEPLGGVRRYLEGLLPALLEQDPELQLRLFAHRPIEASWIPSERLTVELVPWPNPAVLRPLWETWRLPRSLSRQPADLFFSGIGAVLGAQLAPVVVTVQDLAFLKRPEHLPWRYRVYWRWLVARLPMARAVIVPSAATRQDLLEHTEVSPHRVTVVAHAAEDRFRPADEACRAALRRDLGLPGPFVLWVGTREPRKNLGLLGAAMKRLNDGREQAVPLVVVGRRGWGRGFGVHAPWMRVMGAVSDTTLAALYSTASVLAFPSSDEGFGLPVLEAMRCGAPVVVARAGALPEIAGDAGMVLPADDVGAWAETLTRLINEPKLRDRLGALSRARAARYSWTAAARETLAVFHAAAGR